MYTTCSELGIFMFWTCNSMNNLLSYCGLDDARISASEKDLPVRSDWLLYPFSTMTTFCPLIFISEFTLDLTHGTVKTEQWTLGGWRGVVVRRQRRGAQKKFRPVSISCNSSFEKSHFWNRRPRAKNHIDRFQNDSSLGCNHSAWIW